MGTLLVPVKVMEIGVLLVFAVGDENVAFKPGGKDTMLKVLSSEKPR